RARSRHRKAFIRRRHVGKTAAKTGRSTEFRSAQDRNTVKYYAGRIRKNGARRQGIHHGRRYFSGGAVTTLRSTLPVAAIFALSRTPPHQSRTLSLFSQFRRLRRRGV